MEVTVTRDFTRSWQRSAPGHAVLVVISGPRLGHRAVLSEQPLELGRGSSCGLQLDADSVSRLHARVEWDGHAHRLVDLKSTNGSFVNEQRVSERRLSDGDRVQIGKVLLKYISGQNVESAYHEEIQRLMRYDGLTGVHNKSHFDEMLSKVLWRAPAAPMSLIVLDLDHFKSINDTRGHTAGDAVLRQVAGVLAQQMPAQFLFARVGGEEFAVVCSGVALNEARQFAEQLRQAVEATRFSFEQTLIPVTVSLGVAERYAEDASPAALYARADTQLYEAKGAGRNCVR